MLYIYLLFIFVNVGFQEFQQNSEIDIAKVQKMDSDYYPEVRQL